VQTETRLIRLSNAVNSAMMAAQQGCSDELRTRIQHRANGGTQLLYGSAEWVSDGDQH